MFYIFGKKEHGKGINFINNIEFYKEMWHNQYELSKNGKEV